MTYDKVLYRIDNVFVLSMFCHILFLIPFSITRGNFQRLTEIRN